MVLLSGSVRAATIDVNFSTLATIIQEDCGNTPVTLTERNDRLPGYVAADFTLIHQDQKNAASFLDNPPYFSMGLSQVTWLPVLATL